MLPILYQTHVYNIILLIQKIREENFQHHHDLFPISCVGPLQFINKEIRCRSHFSSKNIVAFRHLSREFLGIRCNTLDHYPHILSSDILICSYSSTNRHDSYCLGVCDFDDLQHHLQIRENCLGNCLDSQTPEPDSKTGRQVDPVYRKIYLNKFFIYRIIYFSKIVMIGWQGKLK